MVHEGISSLLSGFRRLRTGKHRSVILSTVLLVLALIALGTVEAVTSYRALVRDVKRQTEIMGVVLEQQTRVLFENLDLLLRHVVDRVESRDPPSDLHAFLTERMKKVSFVTGIHLVDRNGNYYGSSLRSLPAANLADRDYFIWHREHSSGDFVISKPLISRSVNQWVVTLSRRVNGARGEFAGVVVASVSLKALNEFHSSLDLGRNGVVSLWDSDRVLLTRHPFDDKGIGHPVPPIGPLRDILGGGLPRATYFGPSSVDGIERVFHYRKVEGLPLAVIVGIAQRDYLQGWMTRTSLFLLVAFSASFASMLMMSRYLKASDWVDRERTQSLQNAKLTSLGVMAAGVAHEINNPLAVIRARAVHIQDLVRGAGSWEASREQIEDFAVKIMVTADRISRIIRGLRVISRDSAHECPTWVWLPVLLENALNICRERFRDAGIELRVPEPAACFVECREPQIVECLINLLGNAYDAMVEGVQGGEGRWVELRGEFNGEWCRITVRDNGAGVPAEIVDRIMEPFFTTKEAGKGSGLGLSLSKAIIEQHRGTLTLDRQSAETCFVVTLPARATVPEGHEEANAVA